MEKAKFLDARSGRRLAYHLTEGNGPGVVFLGGLASDMSGTKAVFLEDWAKQNGRMFLRFDYSGHGESSNHFTDGSIGDWAQDARDVIETLTTEKLIFVGSSMGGWITCLMAKQIPDRMAGFVGIAAAPDFTEDSMWKWMTQAQKAELEEKGMVPLPSDYGEPYWITKRLIEDGRENLVLRDPLEFPCPVRLLHGTADEDVDISVALSLLEHAKSDDMSLLLVDGADHRFSDEKCLNIILTAITELS